MGHRQCVRMRIRCHSPTIDRIGEVDILEMRLLGFGRSMGSECVPSGVFLVEEVVETEELSVGSVDHQGWVKGREGVVDVMAKCELMCVSEGICGLDDVAVVARVPWQ